MERTIQSELLDELAATDPRAIHSRRDLRLINTLMGNRRIMAHALRKTLGHLSQRRIVELGAGDGEYLLRVARKLGRRWNSTDATLVDQQELLGAEIKEQFRKNGWHVRSEASDVIEWLERTQSENIDAFLANLFLHHFEHARLRELFGHIARRTQCFIAVEPHRARWPHLCSRLLCLVGCNEVTCHDATISVSAGFKTGELSALWPDPSHWELTDRRAGLFSHLFIARKRVNDRNAIAG